MSDEFDELPPLELEIPEGADGAREAVELLRAFVGDGALHIALNSDAFGDRIEDWGRVLGQIAHHVARAAELQAYMSEQDALKHIRRGIDGTLPQNQPTMSGTIRGRVSH